MNISGLIKLWPAKREEKKNKIVPQLSVFEEKKNFSEEDRRIADFIYRDVFQYARQLYSMKPQDLHNAESIILPAVEKLIKIIVQDKNEEIILLTRRESPNDYLPVHSVNVAVLSIKMGKTLNLSKDELMILGISAFSHDIGLYLLKDVVNKMGSLNKEELQLMQKHPDMSISILSDMSLDAKIKNEVLKAVHNEHERVDGTGYPLGLKGNMISRYAKIIGLVDSYEALTHGRPYKRGGLSAYAIKKILKEGMNSFDKSMMRVFVEQFCLYFPGTFVKLNSGAIAQVKHNNYIFSAQPLIEIIADSKGNWLEKSCILSLSHVKNTYIKKEFYESDLNFVDKKTKEYIKYYRWLK